MNRVLIAIAGLLFISSVTSAWSQSLQWEKLINPGECPPITCSYVDSDKVYLGSKFGTVYRSSDEGLSWTQIGDAWKDVRIRSVAARHDTMYVVTDSALFRSIDDGQHWNELLNYLQFGANGNPCFGGPVGFTGDTLIVGTQFGACLKGKLDASNLSRAIQPSLGIPQTLVIYRSKKGGAYVGHDIYGLTYTWEWDGIFWRRQNDGFPPNDSKNLFFGVNAVAEIDDEIVAVTDSGLYHSNSNSINWSLLNTTLRSGTSYTGNTYALVSHDKYLFAGTDGGLLRSEDNGVSWKLVNADITDTVRTIAVVGNTLLAGTHFCVYRSTDNGDSWKPAINGLTYRLYPVVCFSRYNGVLYCGTDGGGIYKSTNSGLSWEANNGGVSDLAIRNLSTYNSMLLAGCAKGAFIQTGYSWQLYNLGMSNTSIYSFGTYGGTLLAGGGQGYVYSLNTSDTTWMSFGKILTQNYVAAVSTIGGHLFAGTNGDGAYSSTDGKSWQSVSAIPDARVIAFTTIGPYVFAATGGSGVFRSSDNGDHWEAENTGLTNQKVRSLISYSSYLFAGTDDGVFESKNQGANWVQENDGLQTLKMASLYISGSYIYAATNGSGIYRAYLGERGVASRNLKDEPLALYPNPASTEVAMQLPQEIEGECRIALYDLLGNCLYQCFQSVSRGKTKLPLTTIGSGSYTIIVTGGDKRYTGRLTISK